MSDYAFDFEERLLYRLPPGVGVQNAGCLLTFFCDSGASLRIHTENGCLANALLALVGGGISGKRLRSIVAGDGFAQRLEQHLRLLRDNQMLEYAWHSGGVERLVLTGLCPAFEFAASPLDINWKIAISRFSYLRREGTKITLESPEALCQIRFTCLEPLHWFALFAEPVSVASLFQTNQPCLGEFAEVLWSTHFLQRMDIDEPADRAAWEFQDLLFHWRTRAGRVSGPQCGTYRFLGKWDSPPAVKLPMSESSISLPVPPADESRAKSQDFIEIMDSRRSIREQGRQPLALEHLARLLYFTARIKQRLPGDSQELLLRPAPAAGAIHEIEFYLAIGQCQGVNRGLYHYHAGKHALYRLPTSEESLSVLLDDAAVSWGKPHDPPQVLIILASRVPRIAWKYEGVAYRLSLLNAGVIMQCLYLLATEMRLACSAIGGGDSSVFATATGQDPLTETSIAEFAVGSLAEDAL